MGLIKCPKCGEEISDEEESCPNCGYQLEQKKEDINSNDSEPPKSNKKKFICILGIGVLALVCIVGIGISFHIRKENINKAQTEINQQLSKVKSLEKEVYFNPKYENNITEIKTETKNAVAHNNVKKLLALDKDSTTLYNAADKEIQEYNGYFKKLNDEIKQSETLISDYYAMDYDVSKFNDIKDKAKSVISTSDYKEYKDTYDNLSEQNKLLEDYIEKSKNESYSVQTENEPGAEFPFEIKETDLPTSWSFQPIAKQTLAYPTEVTTRESKILGEPNETIFNINQSSNYYVYSIRQIPVKEITVQDENREEHKAFVNTEVDFAIYKEYVPDHNTELNQRPAYLFVDKNNHINLALQSYEGEDFYALYSMYTLVG
ncbi:MAG: zinc-ribbon domain-containing protein [Suipraeoptans sp.]